MKCVTVFALIFAALSVMGCGNDDTTPNATQIIGRPPDATAAAGSPSPLTSGTAAATNTAGAAPTPASGETAEVQGIVGAVDKNAGTIEINRLQGANVRSVKVNSRTKITSARGGALQLGDLRPSDRIIAHGAVAGDSLVAVEVTVGQVAPGSNPGG